MMSADEEEPMDLIPPTNTPSQTPAPSSGIRESVSTVTDGLSFGLNTAKVITQFSFGFAKFATSTSINLVKAGVDAIGANTGLDGTGITPLISGTLTIADKVSNAGIRFGEYFTNLGLDLANGGVDQVGNVFGNTEMNAAIEEFAALVMREMARDLDQDDDSDVGVLEVLQGDDEEVTRRASKRTLASIGTLETIKSITAWICLQRITISSYDERALAACADSLLGAISSSQRLPDNEMDLDVDSTLSIHEMEIDERDVVVGTSSENTDIVHAHIGNGTALFVFIPLLSCTLFFLTVENDSLNQSIGDVNALSTARLFQNIRRYIRFSAGSYGKLAINVLDPSSITLENEIEHARHAQADDAISGGHAFFSTYTSRPLPTIYHTTHHNQKATENHLLSSVSSVPRILPENNTHYNPTFYIVLDHPNKSVVLCLRGTLSLHDLLVDLSCDYTEHEIQGENYLVHSGMFNAAERVTLPSQEWTARVAALLQQQQASKSNGLPNPFRTDPTPPKVYEAVLAGLNTHPGYSLIITGHSLGAGLASLITLQWGDASTGFVRPETGFPPTTRIHSFSYATPAIIAQIIKPANHGTGPTTTGYASAFNSLVTNLVIGDDFVPDLSLGSVRDLTNVVAYMHGTPSLANSLISQYVSKKATGAVDHLEASKELNKEILEKCFRNKKLYPVGRSFWVQKAGGVDRGVDVREIVRPEQGMFGELVFSIGMMGDHMPTLYEKTIRGL
ncbi:UNVERIFIED_CONTAM: hypothetical protein HDU68_004263 [Siphonaria sp. JEL0065]|nr:hypothetical protein HDU68_004263 [Siphonaria sp. JEL0065]